MRSEMRKCASCEIYTLKDKCPRCDLPTIMPIPARYSPSDRFGKYRRAMKLIKG